MTGRGLGEIPRAELEGRVLRLAEELAATRRSRDEWERLHGEISRLSKRDLTLAADRLRRVEAERDSLRAVLGEQEATPPEPKHTVTVAFEYGWTTVRMTCPFDLADESRPCWPRTIGGEPEPAPQDFCNWKEWFDSSGGAESMREHVLGTWPVASEWDGEAMWFTVVAASAPQGEAEPIEEQIAEAYERLLVLDVWAGSPIPAPDVHDVVDAIAPLFRPGPQGEAEPPKGAA